MKLYVFGPDGHGEHIFSIVAESEKLAFDLVDAHVKEKYGTFHPEHPERTAHNTHSQVTFPSILEHWTYSCYADGWGTDRYYVDVYEVGKIAEFDNA